MEEKNESKICPLRFSSITGASKCVGPKCALCVHVVQTRPNDPFHYWEYEGCGLVNTVPWVRKKYSSPKENERVEGEKGDD